MKHLFRLSPVQSTLAFLLAGYLNLVTTTMRWRIEASADVSAELAKPEGGMVFFWHGRIALGAVARGLMRGRPMRVMISLSPDGEFIAKAAAMLGFPAIRGSTARRPGAVGKGGAAACVSPPSAVCTHITTDRARSRAGPATGPTATPQGGEHRLFGAPG